VVSKIIHPFYFIGLCNGVELPTYLYGSETNSRPVSQKIPRLLWNPKDHCCVHNSTPLFPLLSQINQSTPSQFTSLRSISVLSFPLLLGLFSLHHHVQNSSGDHPASYPMSTRGSFPGGKAAGA